MRTLRALVAGIVLSAVLVVPALAVGGSSAETLTIDNSMSLSVPASFDYGTIGDLSEHGATPANVVYGATGAASLTLDASDLVGSAHTFAASVRRIVVGATSYAGFVAGTAQAVGSIPTIGGSNTDLVSPFVTLPSLVAGTYAGSLTWTLG